MRSVPVPRPPAEPVPREVSDYLAALAHRVDDVLGELLAAVWTTGSLALGDYRPGRSDIDVMVAAAGQPPADTLRRLARSLDHAALRCPAAGLELVVYPLSVVIGGGTEAGYLLNLNTGEHLPPVFSLDPTGQVGFWFAIDRAVTRQSGWALHGPEPGAVIAAAGRGQLLDLVLQSLEEHARADAGHLGDNAVLNACRALRFAEDGRWYAKREAAVRTLGARPKGEAALVRAALASFAGGRDPAPLGPGRVRDFIGAVHGRVQELADGETVRAERDVAVQDRSDHFR